jgi:iron complex outermembrane receptor protein
MIKRVGWSSALLLLSLLFALPVRAQTDARITGVVRYTDGSPVAGAIVTATSRATGASRRATTSADGAFSIAVAPGAYTVSASFFGYEAASRSVDAPAGAAASADFALEPLRLESVTVTATLREQALADVPFSIAAPTAQVLRSRGVEDIEGIAINVAGFSVQNLGPGQSQVAMRGASSGQIARDQPGVKEQVGAYLDDVPISLSLFTPDLDLFDIARVEVLRGPQGTLFGAGSVAGTVRYISGQPEPGVRRVFGEFGGSWIDGGGPGGNVKGGVNLPLGEAAAARVVAYHSWIGGYMDAVQPGLSVREDVNSGTRTGGRAAVRLDVGDRLTFIPRVLFQRMRTDGWNRVDAYNILANPYTTSRPAVTLGPREQFIQIEEPFSDDFLLADLNAQYRLGAVSLTSVTSYTHRDILVVRDAGALTGSITGGSIGLPEDVYTLDAPLDDATDVSVWTQELRLAGGAQRRLQWVLGGFYSGNQRDYAQTLLVSGFEARTGIPTRGLAAGRDELYYSDLSYDLKQFAVFGEATMQVLERLSLTGGLRYYNFDEEREQVFDGIFAHDNTGTAVVSVPGSTSASGFAPRVIASYRASPGLTLNAQASRGVRLGGINDPLNEPLCTPQDLATFRGRDSWTDETAWNYEVGAKARMLDGRAGLNLSAFYMDISDLQLVVTAGSCSSRLVFNVPRARSRGMEAEFNARPSEHLDFSLSGSYTDSELQSTLTSTSAGGQVTVVSGIESGNRLPSVPRFQGSAAATWQQQVGRGSIGFVTGTVQHVGSRYTQIDDLAQGFGTVDLTSFGANTIGGPLTATTFTFDAELPAYTLANLRVGMIRGSWEAALYVNNLTDERALLALDRERGTRARVGYLTNPPRTVGVTFRFSY